MQKELLRMENIVKTFPGVKALNNAAITVHAGEVMGFMGENGAGKSTLMNVLGGVFPADSGEIYIEGKKVEINSIHESQALGVAFIHQELALEPYLTIAENIFLGREIKNLGMTICPFSPTFAVPKMCLPLGFPSRCFPPAIVTALAM